MRNLGEPAREPIGRRAIRRGPRPGKSSRTVRSPPTVRWGHPPGRSSAASAGASRSIGVRSV